MPIISKKITDLATIATLSSSDMMLVGTSSDTYNVAFDTVLSKAHEGMVSDNWGSSNVGKYLVVGEDGNVKLGTGGGGGGVSTDVIFRDYDGTIVQSYSAADFLALTAMPENPSHEGLTAQGWNWTLSDAKAYVTDYGKLEIGQMYITTDGKTHVYIHLEQGRTSPMLGCCPDGTVDVDWGDGTTHDTLTGTSTTTAKWTRKHAYVAPGDYVIKLTVTGSMGFYSTTNISHYSALLRYATSDYNENYVYLNAIQRVEIGNGVSNIGDNAFNSCYSLASITIPDGVTNIGNYAFRYCYSLASITIPESVTNIGKNAFDDCYCLASITIPDGVTSIGYAAFSSCSGLASITIPDSVTSISNYAFNSCSGLASITITDSVTSIGDAAFGLCSGLASITIPDGVTNIGAGAFVSCFSLASITIPESVTNIGNNAFKSCFGLASITIPDGVTNIGAGAFVYCYGVAEYHIASILPPTLSNKNAFDGIADDCVIYVPYSTDHSILAAYQAATNWSYYASRMQEEPQ